MDRVNCWCQCISLASVVNASGAGCTLGSLNLLSDQAHRKDLGSVWNCRNRRTLRAGVSEPRVKAQLPVWLNSEALSIRVKFKLELQTASSAAGEVGCFLLTV